MPSYKLQYFNGKGRAEIIRLALVVAGQEFEDVRIERDDWPKFKPDAPFGQMPILEVDGVKLCQANACARLVAKRFNLAGKTDLEQAQVDMVIECLDDAAKPIIVFAFEKDEAKKAELKKKYVEEQLPEYFTHLEKLVKANQGGDKFFVGSELTLADLAFFSFLDWATGLGGAVDPLGKFPKLKALHAKVGALPKIAAWVAKRPVTPF